MTNKYQPDSAGQKLANDLRVIRHNQVCQKLGLSSAKLFDMQAKGIFPKPFTLIPGGRAVGWLEDEIDQWILDRKSASEQEAK
jgi:prophage regulatory protein